MNRYQRAEAMVIQDPEIMGGVPVVRGTRIPVLPTGTRLIARKPIRSDVSSNVIFAAETT